MDFLPPDVTSAGSGTACRAACGLDLQAMGERIGDVSGRKETEDEREREREIHRNREAAGRLFLVTGSVPLILTPSVRLLR